MSYKVDTIANFEREAKQLLKKYPSLRNELGQLIDQLSDNPEMGTHLGDDVYKIRLAIKSKGKGKRGGARVIIHVRIINETVYLLSIYDKGKQSDIAKNKILGLLQEIEQIVIEDNQEEE